MAAVNLQAKLAQIDAPWVPRVVGALNGQLVKLARFEGPYTWHHHENEDELFLVVTGHVEIHLRDPAERVVHLDPGEFFIVPRGIEHKPVAPAGAGVLLFEPASTRNTGNITEARTIEPQDLREI